jgi:hypothetical protein
MASGVRLGQAAGLEFRAERSALGASLLLWGVLSVVAARRLGLRPGKAAAYGLVATGGHWASAIGHHLGHAVAAQSTGFPMSGVRLQSLFGSSLYPPDEQIFSAATHRLRALGGPAASLLLSLASGGAALALRRRGGLPLRLAQFLFVDNLFAFTIGALLPLGFTDGSTLLRLRGKN